LDILFVNKNFEEGRELEIGQRIAFKYEKQAFEICC